MLKESVSCEIEAMLSQAPNMTLADFQVVRSWERTHYDVCKSARDLLKLGAADFSWLDKRVRETVGPSVGMLRQTDVGLATRSVFMVLGAAQAIVRRDRLSEDQYEGYVGGFRQVGVPVPEFRDGQAASAAQ